MHFLLITPRFIVCTAVKVEEASNKQKASTVHCNKRKTIGAPYSKVPTPRYRDQSSLSCHLQVSVRYILHQTGHLRDLMSTTAGPWISLSEGRRTSVKLALARPLPRHEAPHFVTLWVGTYPLYAPHGDMHQPISGALAFALPQSCSRREKQARSRQKTCPHLYGFLLDFN